jgi:putative salt-induced outer membrane protein YdiY
LTAVLVGKPALLSRISGNPSVSQNLERREMRMGRKVKILGVVWNLFFFLLLLGVGEALADKIILENGDALTGTVEKVIDGKLTFITDYAGPIVIPISKIKEILTDKPLEIHLSSGEVLKGKIKTVEDNKLMVEESPERAPTAIEIKSVASINPPPVKWTGAVAAGGNLQSGNTDRASGFISAEVGRRTEKDRIKFRYLFNYGEEDKEVTTRNHYGEAKYDYFFTKKFFGYLGLEVYNDRFKDTNLRTFVGPGVGYQVWEDPQKFLLFEAGLSYFSLDRYRGDDESGITARLGWDFRYSLLTWLIFTERLQFYPTIGEGGDYFFRNEAGLNVPLSAHWSLKVANIIDYNSDPSSGFKRTDVQYIGALQFSF